MTAALERPDPRSHARRTDPDTSRTAAERLTDKATMMARLLVTYLDANRTTDEAIEAAGYEPADGAWKRVSDLANHGLIADTGERRVGNAGREQIVREITRAGLVQLADWLAPPREGRHG